VINSPLQLGEKGISALLVEQAGGEQKNLAPTSLPQVLLDQTGQRAATLVLFQIDGGKILLKGQVRKGVDILGPFDKKAVLRLNRLEHNRPINLA